MEQACRSCREMKAPAEFDVRADTEKRTTLCKVCRRTYQRERWQRIHPPRIKIPADCHPEIKACGRCGEIKLVDEFAISSRSSDGRQSWCRDCFSEVHSSQYEQHRARELERVGRNQQGRRRRNAELLLTYLAAHACVDCGERDPVILEFDHLRDKRADVTALANHGLPWATLADEIAKCEVRCANCHRIRTGQRAVINSLPFQLDLEMPQPVAGTDPSGGPDRDGTLTQICRKCRRERPLVEFSYRSRSRGVVRHVCRACQSDYHRDWYQRSRPQQIVRLRRNRRKARQNKNVRRLVWQYLLQHPCVDCGATDPRFLDFDHVRGKKSEIGTLIRRGTSWRIVMEEISKCEVRCANCHRRRTAVSLGHYRSKATVRSRTSELDGRWNVSRPRPRRDSNARPTASKAVALVH